MDGHLVVHGQQRGGGPGGELVQVRLDVGAGAGVHSAHLLGRPGVLRVLTPEHLAQLLILLGLNGRLDI